MPCSSDGYPEQSTRNCELQRVAKLLIYALSSLGEKVYNKQLLDSAEDEFCRRDWADNLCALIRGMSTTQADKIIYDGRNAMARDLADWWEQHQKEDMVREAREKAERAALVRSALLKLTPDEKIALIKHLKY